MSSSLPLPGCTPTPLAAYLKALGVLRLLSEQCPAANVRGAWERGCFVLHGNITREELLGFFLNNYLPTPIIAPWNGGSGFYFREEKAREKDPTTGKRIKTGARNEPTASTRIVDSMLTAKSNRFHTLAESIRAAKSVLEKRNLKSAPKENEKVTFLLQLRNTLPEKYLDVLDAAFVLLRDEATPPPLLGTGLNDGNLDFSSNFMQRLTDLLHADTGEATAGSRVWLEGALFNVPILGLTDDSIGQFHPGASGGANSSTGFSAKPAMNPWDFVLMLEGALLFAGAAVKRLESGANGQLAYPFCVRNVGVGYGSSSSSDESFEKQAIEEIWMPTWEKPAELSELKALLSEGRAQVHGRPARHAVDFARAVASLGVDRGINAFERYGFLVRKGKSCFATPLGRVPVRRNQLATQMLGPLDAWLDRFRHAARKKKPGSDEYDSPSSIRRAAQRLESAILAFCKSADPHRTQELLIALGRCERIMAGSQKWVEETFLKPIPLLQPRWLSTANTGTPEYRLAASLAGLTGPVGKAWRPLRCQLEPVAPGRNEERRWFYWQEKASRDVVWHDGSLADALNAILARRVLLATQGERLADSSPVPARLADVAAFIENRTDDRLLAALLWGLCLVDFGADYGDDFKLGFPADDRESPAIYALLKLCFSRHGVREIEVPLVPAIQRRAVAGDGAGASLLAARRLRACGLPVAVSQMHIRGEPVRRSAAALLFPLTAADTNTLAERVLRPKETELQPNDQLT